ncbi:MAG: group III truncated hemoglobin [Flavobacteriales bacterium]|nr:group III truncated hemoglobin [Flavobacteriales bacterium]
MKDILVRGDIIRLLDRFYDRLFSDDIIGHFFTDVMDLSRKEHMPIMYNFWDSILLGAANYHGNPMEKHIRLSDRSPMHKEHFERWLLLWTQSVDELFKGSKAEEAKKRAADIAMLMEFKVQNHSA